MNEDRMYGLTRDLIAIDSTTGAEGEITDFLETHLCSRGMQVRCWKVSPGRDNLLASWQNGSPKILFNTHIDTVPEQYGPHEDGERIYGRGACDTHGVLAAQLEAIELLHHDGLTSHGLLLVVGEETDHDGAIAAGQCDDIVRPECLIVGEPTENKLMTSQKGRLKGSLLVYGVEGHSGYPERFSSAVDKLVRLLSALQDAPWLAHDSQAGTTLNTVIKTGGNADNQIPAFAHARLMFRCAEGVGAIKEQTVTLLQDVAEDFGMPPERGRHFELVWDKAQNDPIDSLSTLPGFETAVASYNTDIAYFGWRCPTFLLGPGSILQAHRDLNDNDWLGGEWIAKTAQMRGVEQYRRLVSQFIAQM